MVNDSVCVYAGWVLCIVNYRAWANIWAIWSFSLCCFCCKWICWKCIMGIAIYVINYYSIGWVTDVIYFYRLHLTVCTWPMLSCRLGCGRRLASRNLHSKSTQIYWQSQQQRPLSWKRKGWRLDFTSFKFCSKQFIFSMLGTST